MDKKAQGLSLNVIIIAALALIVLVVLVVVFTGRIGLFEKGVSKEADTELVKMRITYGNCRPTGTAEIDFKNEFAAAEDDEAAQEMAKAAFADEISRCKGSRDEASCEAAGCKW